MDTPKMMASTESRLLDSVCSPLKASALSPKQGTIRLLSHRHSLMELPMRQTLHSPTQWGGRSQSSPCHSPMQLHLGTKYSSRWQTPPLAQWCTQGLSSPTGRLQDSPFQRSVQLHMATPLMTWQVPEFWQINPVQGSRGGSWFASQKRGGFEVLHRSDSQRSPMKRVGQVQVKRRPRFVQVPPFWQ